MKRFLPLLCCFFSSLLATAQTQSAAELHETAKSFIRQADYANAILVLNRAVLLEPQNIGMAKDLALSYYYQKDLTHALEVIKPVLDRDEADDQCFQIAGNIYKQLEQFKECEKLYKKGIKKFPDSGPLYNELGELQWAQKDFSAIKQWEQGIEADPSYSKNYYNAARYYFLSPDKIWSLLYGEIFLNMEPLSNKAPEVKQLLLDGYKKLFTEANLENNSKDKNGFAKAYLQSMSRQGQVAATGLTTETLTMLRTRFILDWFNTTAAKYPFRLFEQQQQLLKEGMFDAYNQWLFGSVQNLPAYQNWTNMHNEEQTAFTNFQRGRIFKIPAGQYYH
ncbi:MAG: tetratricopeptide repeat protein [Ferruginibacter sp.]|nr:tetratricopeptide repeat protein [Ferruginibacter sp.]